MPRPIRTRQTEDPNAEHAHRPPGSVTLLIFVSGAVLMALEIAGSRVLAPFFGSSVFVWGSLIGIFLGAMSGGYWLGGWLSERWPRQILLNALLAAAGGFHPAPAPVGRAPVPGAGRWPRRPGRPGAAPGTAHRRAGSLRPAEPAHGRGLAVRGAPAGPGPGAGGRGSGRLYAVGTLGSIVGTLVTAFWLIPAFGVNTILTGIGALLAATAAFTLPFGRHGALDPRCGRRDCWRCACSSEPPVLLAQPAKGRFEIIETRDSAYSSMTVVDHLLPGPGGRMAPVARQLRFGKYVQGAVFVHPWQQRGREHWSAAPYTDLFHLARLFTPGWNGCCSSAAAWVWDRVPSAATTPRPTSTWWRSTRWWWSWPRSTSLHPGRADARPCRGRAGIPAAKP